MPASILSDLLISKIWAINRINLPPRDPIERIARERWAVAIKTAGRTIYQSAGRTAVSDINHVVVLPQGATYRWLCHEPGECVMIEFDAVSAAQPEKPEPVSIRVGHLADIYAIAGRLEQLWVFRKPAYTVKCMAGLYEIIARLFDAELTSYGLSEKHRLIQPSVSYLERHYNQPDLSNDHLAAMSGLSTVYFRKIFTGIYRVSPMKYVQSIRIAKAKDMLVGEYCPVGAVAAAIGFENIYHFCKTFKKMTGYTPTAFARLHRTEGRAAQGRQLDPEFQEE
jgi:AraC-like DNA-binding protein